MESGSVVVVSPREVSTRVSKSLELLYVVLRTVSVKGKCVYLGGSFAKLRGNLTLGGKERSTSLG